MALTQKWLSDNVGKPSTTSGVKLFVSKATGTGSKYSLVYDLTGDFEKAPSPKKFELGVKINDLLNDWSWSAHSGAKSEAERATKQSQVAPLLVFQTELKTFLLTNFKQQWLDHLTGRTADGKARGMAEVGIILQEMEKSASPLLRNTAFQLKNTPIVLTKSLTEAGAMMSNGQMNLSVSRLSNKTLAMGTMVHECHHKLFLVKPLTIRDPLAGKLYKYLDEFIAHWKQYEVEKIDAGMRGNQVNVLLKKLYFDAYSEWEKRFRTPLSHIDQTGDFKITDNSGPLRNVLSRRIHGRGIDVTLP